MKKLNKKHILIIECTIVVIVAAIVAGVLILTNKNNKNEEKVVEVSVIEPITPLSSSNSSEASEMIKENIVKIINTINDDTRIVGTGFFDKSGYLVTNSHIIDIKGKITVEYADGSKCDAQIYSNDITSDIALVAVENPTAKAMFYGKTLTLNVTDDVYAVGYPYALEGEASVSKGILSARRSAGGIEFLQSDISLSSGNSGGPLINDKGELLGINTYATENASIGMSISSESLEVIIKKLIDKKSVNYLDGDRPTNALSVVLTEIGYHIDDIYGQKDIIENHVQCQEDDDKKEDFKEDFSGEKINSNTNSNSNNKEETIPEPKKSSDSSLSSLVVENYNIGFSSSNKNYNIELSNQEIALNISAQTTDNKAKYEIKGNADFKEGNNTVSIIVTAEDSSITEYKIIVNKPISNISKATGIIPGLDVKYSSSKGTNCFDLNWDYKDSDGVRVYTSNNIDINIYNSVKVNVYAGWEDWEGTTLRFLKSYNLNKYEIKNRKTDIPLTDIRPLLNDVDYEGGAYSGADLTFEIVIDTKTNGIIKGKTPWGLSK